MTFQKLYNLTTIIESLESRLPSLLKSFPNHSKQSISQISHADPSKNKKYLTWILKNSNQFRFPEDINKIKSTLSQFTNLSNSNKWKNSKDINSYKSFKELSQTIENNTNIINTPIILNNITNKQKIKEQDHYIIYKITNAETIKELAKNTHWCIREEPYASDYLKKGPYYIIMDIYNTSKTFPEEPDKEIPLILIHYPTAQIKDAYDSPISSQLASDIYPLIQNTFKYAKFNYNEGIGDFNVFLNKQKNSTQTIAQNEDKEILEKYNAPALSYDILASYHLNKISPLELKKHKENISKSPTLITNFLIKIKSLHSYSRDTFLEEKLLKHNDPYSIIKYMTYLFSFTPHSSHITEINDDSEHFTVNTQQTIIDFLQNYYIYKSDIDKKLLPYNINLHQFLHDSLSHIIKNYSHNPQIPRSFLSQQLSSLITPLSPHMHYIWKTTNTI